MATKRKTIDEESARKRLITAWSAGVRDAGWELLRAASTTHPGQVSTDPGEVLGAHALWALRMTDWLAQCFAAGELDPMIAGELDRFAAAVDAHRNSHDRVPLLLRTVDELASRYLTASNDERRDLTRRLVFELCRTEPAFVVLIERLDEIAALLERYGQPSRRNGFTTTGLLAKLNTMARWPLGKVDHRALQKAGERRAPPSKAR